MFYFDIQYSFVYLGMSKRIIYGSGILHLESGLPPEVNITAIHIDNFAKMCTIVKEKGLNVKTFTISMEQAQRIGFINIDALEPYV
jgi:hypothetical protein